MNQMSRTFIRDKECIVYRILKEEQEILIIDCETKRLPFWITREELEQYADVSDYKLPEIIPMDELTAKERCTVNQRFTMIADIIPYVGDKAERGQLISKAAREYGVSQPTIRKYLCQFLVFQKKEALVNKRRDSEPVLTDTQKNIRWGLNKFYYNTKKNSLRMAYTLMLKEKYCDEAGQLIKGYPSFYQFRYFYRTHNNKRNQSIKRNGLSNYQRNERPLLGDGVQQYAPSVGTGMLDSTICDIYLVNDAGEVVGRPILTACVDAYSGICCGYTLSWEGGVYSLRNLMMNVITDKQEYCEKLGISIIKDQWPCKEMPARLVTDMGAEYASENFSQLAELGITIVNLPPYRPELKGPVEKFFDVVQGYYKPILKGKGVIEPDFRERGAQDYRKDACLTLRDFEKIILNCIVFYNSSRILNNFPYTEEMLNTEVKPYACEVWKWGCGRKEANLLDVTQNQLLLTLLPRTMAKFTRFGLKANKLRYHNENFAEEYLEGKEAMVAYNPDDIKTIWLLEEGEYIRFELIEKRYEGKTLSEAEAMKNKRKQLIRQEQENGLKAEVALAACIQTISDTSAVSGATNTVKNIRNTRKKEQERERLQLEVISHE